MKLIPKSGFTKAEPCCRPKWLAALDLESVLVPEIWQAVASLSGVKELTATTRERQDYSVLMQQRMDLCRRYGLTLAKLRAVVSRLLPFPGAVELLGWIQARMRVVILSDTFYELAQPLLGRLGGTLALCHHLEVDSRGFISGFRLWKADAKREAVKTFRRIGYKVLAVGDSYNDLNMLAEADHGCWFSAPDVLYKRFPQYPRLSGYDDCRTFLNSFFFFENQG